MKLETLTILTARAVKIDGVSVTGAKPMLTRHDAACALAGLDGASMGLAMIKYAGDPASGKALIESAFAQGYDEWLRHGWKVDQRTIAKMSAVALYEAVEKPICRSCKGTGYLGPRGCHVCCGSGRSDLPDTEVAKAIGMPASTYRNPWKDRYSAIRSRIVSHVGRLDSRIRYSVKNW